MKTRQDWVERALVVAVRAALVALAAIPAARAADDAAEARRLTQPTNQIEGGAGWTSEASHKFGEYNGLYFKGFWGIANWDIFGGGLYDSGDPTRWRTTGINMGLPNGSATAEYGQQGTFRINLGFDQIPREGSDPYQTPYLGAGTNNLTLPPTWLPPKVPQVNATNVNFRSFDAGASTGPVYNASGVLTPPTAAQLTQLSNIRANDVPAFTNVDLATKRTRYSGGFSYSFDPQWDFQVSYLYEHKDGVKWMGAVSSQVSEFSIIMPDLINQDTQQVNASVNYKTDKGFLQVGYYGSFFHNNNNSMTWTDVNDLTKSATLAAAPDNEFNQFFVTGAYNFTPATKLVLNGSYARNTQNQAFLGPDTAANGQLQFGLPTTSLDGLVLWTAFNAKLTSKPVKDLTLNVAYKYDDRDNRTPVNLYLFQDANESKTGVSPFAGLYGLPATLGSNTNIYDNRAYSKKLNQFNLQADYAVAKGQWLQGAYDWSRIDRNCNGAWIDCADVARTTENALRAEWRANFAEDFNSRIGYTYAQRRGSNYSENAFLALVPMANFVPAGGATQSVYSYLQSTGLTGFGPVAGLPATPLTGNAAIFSPNNNIVPQALYGSRNNINELVGMRRYFVSDRNAQRLRATLDWQANEKFSFQGSLEGNWADYPDATYGMQNAKDWTLNLEGAWTPSEDFVANLFYTYTDQRFTGAGDAYGSNSTTASQPATQPANTVVSGGCYATVQARNANAKIDPCLNWSKNSQDKNDTIGFTFKQKNLLQGKLDLIGNVLYTYARTDIAVSGGSYVNNPLALAPPAPPLGTTPAVFFIPAANLPTVTTKTFTFGLTGNYTIDRMSMLRVAYLYQRMRSSDYAYDGMQFGTGTNYLPTLEQAWNYNVSVIGVSYIYRWQ